MSDTNPQKTLCEAAMEVRLGKNVVYSDRNDTPEEVEENMMLAGKKSKKVAKKLYGEEIETTPESVVYEYLSSYFGVDLNESIDDITEEQLEEAVESLNVLCAAVNEYFEIEENMYLAPKGKGKKAAKKMY